MKINDEHMFTPPLEQFSPKRQVHFQRPKYNGEDEIDSSLLRSMKKEESLQILK